MISIQAKKIIEEIRQLPQEEQEEIIRAVARQEETEGDKNSEEEKMQRFKSAAGGWADLIPDNFLEEVYKQRRISDRPEVDI